MLPFYPNENVSYILFINDLCRKNVCMCCTEIYDYNWKKAIVIIEQCIKNIWTNETSKWSRNVLALNIYHNTNVPVYMLRFSKAFLELSANASCSQHLNGRGILHQNQLLEGIFCTKIIWWHYFVTLSNIGVIW